MTAWAENANFDSKATIRTYCHQKLEEIILQVWWAKGWVAHLLGTCCLLQRSPRRPLVGAPRNAPGFSPTGTFLESSLTAEGFTGMEGAGRGGGGGEPG